MAAAGALPDGRRPAHQLRLRFHLASASAPKCSMRTICSTECAQGPKRAEACRDAACFLRRLQDRCRPSRPAAASYLDPGEVAHMTAAGALAHSRRNRPASASAPKRNRLATNCWLCSLVSPSPPSSSQQRRFLPRHRRSPPRQHQHQHQLRGAARRGVAMELFPDRAHVRLRSHVQGTYLHADEDGWSVSFSANRASLNTAWAVHRFDHVGVAYVLFHSAAYGRYLALWPQPSPEDQLVHDLVQRVYDTQVQGDIMWVVLPPGDGNDGVRLRHTVDPTFEFLAWTAEIIPPRPLPPNLPVHIPNGVEHPVVLRRVIRYVRADNAWIFDLPWRTFRFHGQSVVPLMGALGAILGVNFNNITLCVRAGFYSRLTPLVIDLPTSEEPMDIVVFVTDVPEALGFQHPDVDAP